MENKKLKEAKLNHPELWQRIHDEWRASAERATDGRPDYAWAQKKAEHEFAAKLGVDLSEEA